MGYVFISYSSKNRDTADAFKNLLNKNNIETWMAPHDIPVGSKYASVIGKSIKNCSCFLLLLTYDSQGSIWVAKEVERAINYKKPIVPIQLEDVILNDEFEMYLSTDQILAIKTIDETTSEIQNLIVTLKVHTKSPTTQETKELETTTINQAHKPTQENAQKTTPENDYALDDDDDYIDDIPSDFPGLHLRRPAWIVLGVFAGIVLTSFLIPWSMGQWVFSISVGIFILLLFLLFAWADDEFIVHNVFLFSLSAVNLALQCWINEGYTLVALVFAVVLAISSLIVMARAYWEFEIKQGLFASLFAVINVGVIFWDKIWGYIEQFIS